MTEKLTIGDKIRVININGGYTCKRKFSVMGIREGSILKITSIQLGHGPYTVKCNKTKLTIGRGMFNKIKYELIK